MARPGVWSVAFTDRAFQDLSGLDKPVAKRVLSKIKLAASDPTRSFERLVGADEWKLRVGVWRVIAALAHDRRAIVVMRIDHRSRVYR